MSHYCIVSAANLRAGGVPITGATIAFAPRLVGGSPSDFNLANIEQHGRLPFTVAVTGGAFSVSIPKSSLSSPLNIAYLVTVTDDLTGKVLLGGEGSGYANFQAFSDTLNFDEYTPITPPQPTVLNQVLAKGDKGDKGDPGNLENHLGPVDVAAGVLGPNEGDELTLMTLTDDDGNFNQLRIYQRRNANGTDWLTASTRIALITDVDLQSYIEFNGPSSPYSLVLHANVPNAANEVTIALDGAGRIVFPTLKATTGKRYLCVDEYGIVTSEAAPPVGT